MKYYDVAVLEVSYNKGRKQIMEIEGSFKYEGVMYYYRANADVSVDKNYGANSDGQKGEEVYFIEELDVISIVDQNDFDVTGTLSDEYFVRDKIEHDIFKKMDQYV
jgi:hypothetical protein